MKKTREKKNKTIIIMKKNKKEMHTANPKSLVTIGHCSAECCPREVSFKARALYLPCPQPIQKRVCSLVAFT